MSRKDFVLIAAALRECKQSPCAMDVKSQDDTLWCVANALADRLAGVNPRFDRERFLTAAGVKP